MQIHPPLLANGKFSFGMRRSGCFVLRTHRTPQSRFPSSQLVYWSFSIVIRYTISLCSVKRAAAMDRFFVNVLPSLDVTGVANILFR